MAKLKRAFIVATLVSMMAFATLYVGIQPSSNGDPGGVDAAMWDKTDNFGYTYVDNNNPDPKIDFDWIDCTDGYETSVIASESYAGPPYYEEYDLPFTFPYYGNEYTSVTLFGCGEIWMGGGTMTSNYEYSQIPYSSGMNGYIGIWNSYSGGYGYSDQDFHLYVKEGTTYGERWVAFEWNKAGIYDFATGPNDQITYEAIIYESGLIKLQYLDVIATGSYSSYSKGAYTNIGIESPDGRDGISYCFNTQKLWDGLAVMFGKEVTEVKDIQIDADTDDQGAVLYAQYRPYKATAEVWHPINSDMIRTIDFSFADGLANLVLYIDEFGQIQVVIDDPDDYFDFYPGLTKILPDIEDFRTQYAEIYFTPTFKYPFNTYQNIKVVTTGVAAIPGSKLIEEVYRVQNNVEVKGILVAISETIGFVENGGWMKASENFILTGFFPVYEGTSVRPPSDKVPVIATEENGKVWEQSSDVSATGEYNIPITTASFSATQKFNISIKGIPDERDKTDFQSYVVKVDPFKPTSPLDIYIHAESYEDDTVSYDNDNEVFVTWETGQDLESGMYGHYLSNYAQGTAPPGEPIFIRYPVTSKKILLPESGPGSTSGL